MDKNHSIEVKREIFEALSESPRFQTILQTVVEYLKRGQEPVVIESWNTRCKKMKPGDELWRNLFFFSDDAAVQKCADLWDDENYTYKTTAGISAEPSSNFAGVTVTFTFKREHTGGTPAHTIQVDVQEPIVSSLTYFGWRDKNYHKLFFKSLGYHVEEGNLGDKHGLLISFGE